MVFCEVCEMNVQEGGNYCYNCGAGVESFQNGKSKYKFTSLDHNCDNIIIFDRKNHRNACKMASNELQAGANAQCPPRLMRAHRFELSTEAPKFYGRAAFLQNSDGLYYGRARFLRKNLTTVSIEQLHF